MTTNLLTCDNYGGTPWLDNSANCSYITAGSTASASATISVVPTQEKEKPAGPLAWLDERVAEITEMGRELMEAA